MWSLVGERSSLRTCFGLVYFQTLSLHLCFLGTELRISLLCFFQHDALFCRCVAMEQFQEIETISQKSSFELFFLLCDIKGRVLFSCGLFYSGYWPWPGGMLCPDVSPRRSRDLDAGDRRNPRILCSPDCHICMGMPLIHLPLPITSLKLLLSIEDFSIPRHQESRQLTNTPSINSFISHFKISTL